MLKDFKTPAKIAFILAAIIHIGLIYQYWYGGWVVIETPEGEQVTEVVHFDYTSELVVLTTSQQFYRCDWWACAEWEQVEAPSQSDIDATRRVQDENRVFLPSALFFSLDRYTIDRKRYLGSYTDHRFVVLQSGKLLYHFDDVQMPNLFEAFGYKVIVGISFFAFIGLAFVLGLVWGIWLITTAVIINMRIEKKKRKSMPM